MSTLTEILIAVRELAYDRYPIPVFVVKQKTGKFVTNNTTLFKVLPSVGAGTPDYTYTYNPDEATDTLENLTSGLIANGYPIAYTGYFSSTDKLNTLLKLTDAPLATHLTMFRRFFLSDLRIQNLILDYFNIVLKMTDETLTTLPVTILELDNTTVRHLSLWIAIQLVKLRQIAESASSVFSLNFTDGVGAVAGSNMSQPGTSVTVQVGSVFTLTDDNSVTGNYFQEDFNRVGSDNVLGDKESFWFKLFLWLRKHIEGEFADFYFRDDNVIQGGSTLTKDSNFLAYFDSYPYTFSPLARNIMSSTNSGN